MKRIAALMLVLVFGTVMLAGCGSSGGNSGKSDSKDSGSAKTEQKEKKDPEKSTEKKSTEKKSVEKKDQEKAPAESKKSSNGSEKAERAVKKNSSSAGSSKKGPSENSSTGKKTAKRTKKAKTCTISISAKRIHASKKADESVKELVPHDGYLLKKTKVTIKSGDTVKSVLRRTAKAHDITVSFKGSDYVAGIGGIFEFDGGSNSGWMYSVNGVFPDVACNEKHVGKGDRIEWKYTLNLGNDL